MYRNNLGQLARLIRDFLLQAPTVLQEPLPRLKPLTMPYHCFEYSQVQRFSLMLQGYRNLRSSTLIECRQY